MARILDTTPAFERFAKKAALESPTTREALWREMYQSAHPAVFRVLRERYPSDEGLRPLLREFSALRDRVREVGPGVVEAIEEIDPKVRETLGLDADGEPLHVLMVGTFSTNAFVARLGEDVAVFHCLEWYGNLDAARVLVAHESAHAWHQLALGAAGPWDDPAWAVFSEGLAILVSRRSVPDRPEEDYFWYGVAGFDDWLPWCREHREELLERFRNVLDGGAEAVDEFFGAGFVEQRWRVGQFIADEVVRSLGAKPPELARMRVEEARAAVRQALRAPGSAA